MDDEDRPRLEALPPLRPVAAWLVKGFPISLREDITRAAAGQGVTVGAWLVAHFSKHGVAGVEITRFYQPAVNSGNTLETALAGPVALMPAPTDDLAALAQIAAM